MLITDAETRAGVAAVRGCDAAGFDVVALAGGGLRVAPGHWSRAAQERISGPSPLTDPAGFLDTVAAIVEREDVDVVVPGSDATLAVLSDARERLGPHVRTGLPPQEIVDRALDKSVLATLAEQHDLAGPETVICTSRDAVTDAVGRLGLPLYVKPPRSVITAGVRRRQSAVRVDDVAALEARRLALGGTVLLQQPVVGPVISFAGVRAGGELIAEAVSRYERSWPTVAGDACCSETIAAPEPLRARVAALLADIGWEGIFELELIDSGNGRWQAIDLNPRIYGSMALALGAGANLPGIWCRYLLGEVIAPIRARPGVHYRWLESDLRARRELAASARPPRRGVVHPYFQASDPGPAIARALELTQTGAAKLRRRPSSQSHPTVIIGAGPNGLAAAAYLRDAGVPTLCFGEPLESWATQMPAGMLLRSQWQSSHIASPRRSLSLDAYARAPQTTVTVPGARLTREQFVAYGRWFAAQAVPDLDHRRVIDVARADDHWRLGLDDDSELAAARVIVAAGISPFARRPVPFDGLGPTHCSHAYDHDDLHAFAGRRVAVIGSGQSALESAALLHEAGAGVEIICRAPEIHWLAAGATPTPTATVATGRWRADAIPRPPTDVGGPLSGWAGEPDIYRRLPAALRPTIFYRCVRPAGAAWLGPRLAGVTISLASQVQGARLDGDEVVLCLTDGSERRVDHVLLGTGYRIDVRDYPFLAPALSAQLRLAGGYPLLDGAFESSLDGLHFLGAPAAHSFGPLMRFVVGSWYAAPALARGVSGRRQPLLTFSHRQAGVGLVAQGATVGPERPHRQVALPND